MGGDAVLASGPVTFPKLVVQAGLAGTYGGLVVALLVLLTNPPPTTGTGASMVATLLAILLVYTLASAVLWPVLYGALRFFASHPLRLPWISLRYVMAFHVANTSVILGSGWFTLSHHRRALGPVVADRLAGALVVLSLSWVCAAAVSIVPRLRRIFWLQASTGGLALAALIASVLIEPGPLPGEPLRDARSPSHAPARRLLLLNFDGADLDTILTLQALGKLPAFSRMRREGAYGRLRSLVPCEAPVTRTTLATGKLPYRHGVRSGRARRIVPAGPWIEVVPAAIALDALLSPVLERRATGVEDRQSLALWDISALLGGAGMAAGWDIDLDEPAPRAGSGAGAGLQGIADLLEPDALRQDDPLGRSLIGEVVAAVEADARLEEDLRRASADRDPGVAALSFPGLDRIAHAFLRYARPGEFGNVTVREVELYGAVLERYYGRIDAIVGRAIEATDETTLLFVTSSHGMEPVPLVRRLGQALTGSGGWSGTHAEAPDGILFVRGRPAAGGQMFGKGSLADLAPTALYALGLPVARDSDGRILAGVFSRSHTLEHPVAVIGTYESGGGRSSY
jgi:type I phosphodiesterase/nucleotide pyrophosphatase